MLHVDSISYQVNGRYLLKDISFSLRAGEMVAILGANGAGKSTLMRLLSGEKAPDSGRVVLDGKQLGNYSRKELSEKRAMLLQQNSISLDFTVQEVVMMGRYGHGNGKSASDHLAVEETMDICGLAHLAERSMLTLSGGEQQRVHLARVLAQLWNSTRAVLLLDEPIASMDMQYQHQTLAIALALTKKGFTVVTVLHDVNLAAQYADRIIMLKGGKKWWDGTPAYVLNPQHLFTAFSIHASVQTSPKNLKTQVFPHEVKLDASAFNTNLRLVDNVYTLKMQTEYPKVAQDA